MAIPTRAGDDDQRKTVTVRMTEEGRIYVGDVYTGLKGMVPRLKREKCPTSTRITVEIPVNASDKAIRQIAAELATGKYFSMAFRKPVVAKAEKKPLPGSAPIERADRNER